MRALDEELLVILERVSVEAFIPVTSLFGVERSIAHEDDGDSSVAAASVDFTKSD